MAGDEVVIWACPRLPDRILPMADVVAACVDRPAHCGGRETRGAQRVGGLAAEDLPPRCSPPSLFKGAFAAIAGANVDGDWTAVGAGLACGGRSDPQPLVPIRGGKGLGVAAGATIVIWPIGLLITSRCSLAPRVLRSSGGSFPGMAWFLGAAALWSANGWSTAWGIDADDTLVWYGIGIVALAAPKFIAGRGESGARSKDSDRR